MKVVYAMDVLLLVALSLWFIFPAYAANAIPVVVGGGKPMDLGRTFGDGRRIFGDGKTYRGFAGGLIGGTLVGIFEAFISGWVISRLGEITVLSDISKETLACTPFRAFMMSTGALLGDLLGSFIKRRLGLRRGAPAPFLDQLTFLFGALTMGFIFLPFQLEYALVLVIITPLMHLVSNAVGYLIGLKKVPW